MVCGLQRRFHITGMTLESKVKVTYNYNLSYDSYLELLFFCFRYSKSVDKLNAPRNISSLFFFNRLCLYLAQYLSVVCRLHRRLQVNDMT